MSEPVGTFHVQRCCELLGQGKKMAMRLVVTSESLSFLMPDGKGLCDSKAIEVNYIRLKGKEKQNRAVTLGRS